jgi:peptide/nickel transport system ATP-binding protein
MSTGDSPPRIETRSLSRHFRVGGLRGKTLHAVDDVDLVIAEREIVALVGESGSGKSTMARLLSMVYRPTSGEAFYRGRPLGTIRSRKALLDYRAQVPMVFQDPFSSLNPVHTIGHTIMRGLKLHRRSLDRRGRQEEAERVLESVGLVPAVRVLARYPHELSGGQRQRVGFAQALSYRPKLILADEPVSMLDVSIRIGLLNLMARLRDEENLSLLYITHDIASARYISDRVLVMYGGHLVESGPTEVVLHSPAHPYTELLLSAVPDPRAPIVLSSAEVGEPPRVVDPGEGCRFRWRCPYAIQICSEVTPLLAPEGGIHQSACHRRAEIELRGVGQGAPAPTSATGAGN